MHNCRNWESIISIIVEISFQVSLFNIIIFRIKMVIVPGLEIKRGVFKVMFVMIQYKSLSITGVIDIEKKSNCESQFFHHF